MLRQTDICHKITNMMINNKKMNKQEISIKTEPMADMETTLWCTYY